MKAIRFLALLPLIPACASPLAHRPDPGEPDRGRSLAQANAALDTAAEIAQANAALDAIAAIPPGERTFQSVVVALDDVVSELWMSTRMTAFLGSVSTDAAERERGRAASQAIGQWFNEVNKRRDLFEACEAVERSRPELDEEDARLLEVVLRDFRREGMGLSDDERARLLEIDNRLSELGIAFRRNIDEDETKLTFAAAELAGVPEDFLEQLERDGEDYVVDLNGPTRSQIFTYCTVGETRKRMSMALGQRVPENVEVLEEMLRLRHERAKLLSYANAADYETEVRMSKNAAAVAAFYEELRPKLRLKALADFEEFQAAKREHTGDPSAQLYAWDTSFYQDWLLRERYAVDSQAVQEYFPLDAVIDGLFQVTQTLYGVEYREITERAREGGIPVWHEDVRLYEVWDTADGAKLGEFYIDLHPRPGKYNHAAQFPIFWRKRWPNGELRLPRVALVCNFTKPTAEKPSLLTHDEVETFFHEFGHCLHSIFFQGEYANVAAVARDFVEAPSQMFEGWVWDADVLVSFSRHYETGEPLPRELLDGMIAAKNLGSGLSIEAQVYLGMMDMAFHTDDDGEVDTSAVREAVYRETRLFDPMPETWGQASFGHLVGYQAGYYGYLWSLVYAKDMFSRFEEEGLMNVELGKRYRDTILSPGGIREELSMVRDFLGREPNSDAFLRHLGLDG